MINFHSILNNHCTLLKNHYCFRAFAGIQIEQDDSRYNQVQLKDLNILY